MDIAYVDDLSVVQRGGIGWHEYAIVKRKKTYSSRVKPPKTYYVVLIDGEDNGEELTLKEARQYVKDFKNSYLENHPDEKG